MQDGWPQIISEWNKTGLPKALKITPQRAKHIKAWLDSKFWRENWREGLGVIAKSEFCQGHNERRWIADFDWFIRSDDALVKALEGKYGKREPASRALRGAEPVTPKYAEGR